MIMILALSVTLLAEGDKKGKAGDNFRAAAVKYETKAQACLDKGYPECAKIYFRMAAIKKNAGQLADEGRWKDISWDEYHKLEAQANELRAKHGVKHKKGSAGKK